MHLFLLTAVSQIVMLFKLAPLPNVVLLLVSIPASCAFGPTQVSLQSLSELNWETDGSYSGTSWEGNLFCLTMRPL